MGMEGVKGKVCVTGGTGFVVSWLIMRLLQDGYSVNTNICSDPGDQNLFEFSSNTSFVHVDDVASAHIFLLECPNARGRYMRSAVDKLTLELPNFLSERYPEYKIPSECLVKQVKDSKYYSFSSEKLLKIGFKYKYGIEEMYDEAIQCCRKKGLL